MKKIIVLALGIILASLILPLALPSPREQWFCSPNLCIYVEAPEESRIGESYSVKITVSPYEEVYINSITIHFYNPNYEETILLNTKISSKFVKTYNLKPENEGISSCLVYYDYVIEGTWFKESHYGSFFVYLTNIREKTYDDLKVAYNDLESSYNYLKSEYNWLVGEFEKRNREYNSLSSNYNSLQSEYNKLVGELEKQKWGTGLSLLSALMLALTTVYLALKLREKEKKT
jgi:hypothetical protein